MVKTEKEKRLDEVREKVKVYEQQLLAGVDKEFPECAEGSFQVEVPKGKKELYRVMIEDTGWHITSYKYDYELLWDRQYYKLGALHESKEDAYRSVKEQELEFKFRAWYLKRGLDANAVDTCYNVVNAGGSLSVVWLGFKLGSKLPAFRDEKVAKEFLEEFREDLMWYFGLENKKEGKL